MLKSSIIAFSLRGVSTFIWLAFTVTAARLLSMEDFGASFYIIAFVQLGATAGLAGYNVTGLRRASQFWVKRDREGLFDLLLEARTVALLGAIVLAVCFVGAALAGVETALNESPIRLALTALLVFQTATMLIHQEILRGTGNLFKAMVGNNLIRTLGTFSLVLIFTLGGPIGVESVLGAMAVSLAIAMTLEVIWLRRITAPRPARLRPTFAHLGSSLGIWPGELAMAAIMRSTILILGFGNDLATVALFVAADRIGMIGVLLTETVRMAIGPELAASAHESGEAFDTVVQKTSALFFVSGLFGGLALAVLGWPILAALGPQYIAAYPFALALLAAQASWTVLGPVVLVANMAGLGAVQSRIASVAAVAMIATQVLLLPLFGPWGVVGALVFTTWAMNLTSWTMIYRKAGVKSGLPGLRPNQIWSQLREEIALLRGRRAR